MQYFVACLLSRTATQQLIHIASMTERTNHRPWDTETLSHKSSHDEYYEKQGATDKTKHMPNIRQARCSHAFGIHESRQIQVCIENNSK